MPNGIAISIELRGSRFDGFGRMFSTVPLHGEPLEVRSANRVYGYAYDEGGRCFVFVRSWSASKDDSECRGK